MPLTALPDHYSRSVGLARIENRIDQVSQVPHDDSACVTRKSGMLRK